MFLWHHIDLKSKSGLASLVDLFKDSVKLQRLGKLVKAVTFSQIAFIEHEYWSAILDSCPNLEYFGVERCHLQQPSTVEHSQQPSPAPKLQTFLISDCASCPVEPILVICARAKNFTLR